MEEVTPSRTAWFPPSFNGDRRGHPWHPPPWPTVSASWEMRTSVGAMHCDIVYRLVHTIPRLGVLRYSFQLVQQITQADHGSLLLALSGGLRHFVASSAALAAAASVSACEHSAATNLRDRCR